MVLYAEIFVFLREVLEWYQQKRWKRVVQSFNESLHKDFQSRIDEIAKVAQKMKDAMFFGLAAEVRVGRMGIDNVGSDLADLQIRQRRNEEEVRYMRERTREQMRAIEDAQERKALLIEQQSPERQKELAHYVVSFLKATFTEQVLTQSLEQLSGGLTVGAPVVSNEPSKGEQAATLTAAVQEADSRSVGSDAGADHNRFSPLGRSFQEKSYAYSCRSYCRPLGAR